MLGLPISSYVLAPRFLREIKLELELVRMWCVCMSLYKSMSAKAPPGRGRVGNQVGKEWTTMEPDSEIKLVRVSGGTSRACFLCEIRV